MKRSPLTRSSELKRTPLPRVAPVKPGPLPKVPARRQRKCKVCRELFTPRSMTHKTCTAACALALVEQDKARALKRERQAGLAKLKRKADYVKEAQQAVNAYVRARDEHLPCISCGRHHDGQNHAGHFLSTGARPGLRFDLRNIHKQCQPCNVHLSGNLINYRMGLIARVGLAVVEELERDDRARHYSIEDLQAIKQSAKQQLKQLKSKGE